MNNVKWLHMESASFFQFSNSPSGYWKITKKFGPQEKVEMTPLWLK